MGLSLNETRRVLTLKNDISEIAQLEIFMEEVCEPLPFGMGDVMKINLAVEELVTNVINYAYEAGTSATFTLEAVVTGESLTFVITDSGKPFDPTQHAEVDVTLSAEERPIGGLGIHLVRQIMDSVSYQRLDDKNVLTIVKKFNQ